MHVIQPPLHAILLEYSLHLDSENQVALQLRSDLLPWNSLCSFSYIVCLRQFLLSLHSSPTQFVQKGKLHSHSSLNPLKNWQFHLMSVAGKETIKQPQTTQNSNPTHSSCSLLVFPNLPTTLTTKDEILNFTFQHLFKKTFIFSGVDAKSTLVCTKLDS